MTGRDHDLVLLGATGFVGRLTARRLAEDADPGTRIALAGRSRDRLESVRSTLPPVARDWPLIVLDLTDESALAELARGTRVLVSTVGPYLRHGLPVVLACAEAGTDYADLTGETLFVRQSIDTADAPARRSGARIVHSCGFDSVPSDLGVGLNAARARSDGAGDLTETVLHVRSMRGGFSGGTIDSLRQQLIETATDPELRALVAAPTALTERAPRSGDAGPGRESGTARAAGRRQAIGRDPATGRWSAPFVMGGFNRQIVLRTDSLADVSYGPGFRYREVIDTGRGPAGAVAAGGVLAGTTALLGGMALAPTRRLLDRLLPDPGQGPSEQVRRNGRFVVEIDSRTERGDRYRTRIAARHDPGYDGTAIMLSQAGLSLAADADLPERSGVITPMIAFGDRLAVRLRAAGFTIQTDQL